MNQKKFRKRKNQVVLAVQIDLVTDGFTYHKWGSDQSCLAGDWLVNNSGDCYTINKETFAETYKEIAPGQYEKSAAVWASKATTSGKVKTNEGYTDYVAGDYLVSNQSDGSDSYAVSAEKFEEMYEEILES